MASTPLITTPRLSLERVTPEHAPLILALLNDQGFIRYIGDRRVRTLAQAEAYIQERFLAHYREHGFGMYGVFSREAGPAYGGQPGRALGTCGLVSRPQLENPDLGFALLPDFRQQGIATEACRGVMQHARSDLGLNRLAAIVQPDNLASMRLLRRLGFRLSGNIRLPGESTDLNHLLVDL